MKVSLSLIFPAFLVIIYTCSTFTVEARASYPRPPQKFPSNCAEARCNRNAVCITENNRARCDCLLGYEFIPGSRNICVPHSKCQSTTCGQNAVCFNTKQGTKCKCKSGYYGNPTAFCDPKPKNGAKQ